MDRPRILKHRYGFHIRLTQKMFFDIDINDWRFMPSIEFYRRPGLSDRLVFAFLCFNLTILGWRFYK